MHVIPAIDLLGGRCVRLLQGSYRKETVYSDDPVAVARRFERQHACMLHVVDLDAARGGPKDNRTSIARICEALDIPVQVGGGIRTLRDISATLNLGAKRIILGTAAVRNPDLVSQALEIHSQEAIIVGVDTRDGKVRIQGWTEGSNIDAGDLVIAMEARGVRRIIYTDISRDGTLEGPNVKAYEDLARHAHHMRFTVSGGVGGFQDLIRLSEIASDHVDSVIVGRAFYENRFPCHQLWTDTFPD